MKWITHRLTIPVALTFVVAFLAAFASASLSWGAEPGLTTAPKVYEAGRVESRIKELHARLKITPEQEEAWNNVAQVMRENAKTMEALIKTRAEKAKTMTAVEDIKSYSEIVDAHADGIKKFMPVFEKLYNTMSDTQKKNADAVFRGRLRSRGK